MFFETTFMWYGKGPGGLIEVILKPLALKVWAYSLNLYTKLLHDLDKMRREDEILLETKHKEEMPARIKKDNIDRSKFRQKLKEYIGLLNTANHSSNELINVATGKILFIIQ